MRLWGTKRFNARLALGNPFAFSSRWTQRINKSSHTSVIKWWPVPQRNVDLTLYIQNNFANYIYIFTKELFLVHNHKNMQKFKLTIRWLILLQVSPSTTTPTDICSSTSPLGCSARKRKIFWNPLVNFWKNCDIVS